MVVVVVVEVVVVVGRVWLLVWLWTAQFSLL